MNTLLSAAARAITVWVLASGMIVLGDATQFPQGRPPGLPGQPGRRPPTTTLPPEPDTPVQQAPTFRTRVELVELTVVATAKDGQFAGDLTAGDFEIFDEGVRQTISAFAKVDIPLPPQSSAPDARMPAGPAATGATSSAIASAPAEDVASSSLHPDARLFVLVLDDLHVAAERTQRVRTSARQFVERHVSPADLVAIVLPSGRKDMLLGFTRDRARLLAVIDRFQGQKLRSATFERDVDKRFGGGSALRDGRDPSDGERAYRAQVSMTTLADVSRLLAATEGRRKSLLYFSEGIDYNVADVMGSVQRYASEVTHAIESALSTAVRTNVAVYAVDPRGLTTTESDAVENPIYAERTVVDLSEPGRGGELGQSIRSLRDLAEPTGGFAATDTNDLDASFARIVRENSSYYVLGFQPSKQGSGGAFRKLEVRVTKPGVTLATRRGYFVPRRATPDPTPQQTAATAGGLSPGMAPLLASALPISGLPIRVHAIPFKGDGSTTSLHVVVEVDGRNLTFASKDSRATEQIDLAMLTVDANGRSANGTQTTLALKLTAEELARVQMTGIRWQSALTLPSGHYQLRVAARASGSARRGMAIAEIDVPDFTTPTIGMSGVALTSLPAVLAITSGSKPPFSALTGPPTAAREFVAGDRITAVAQVYTTEPREDGLRVTARVEAVPDAAGGDRTRAKPLEATQRLAGATGSREEVAFTFGTDALPPGQYTLTLRVHRGDSPALAERRVSYVIVSK
jgi:VWFA-related protein